MYKNRLISTTLLLQFYLSQLRPVEDVVDLNDAEDIIK